MGFCKSVTDCCLGPKLGLQNQLMRSFTSCAVVTLTIITIIIAIAVSILGSTTATQSEIALEAQIRANIGNASYETAMLTTQDFDNFEMMLKVVREATLDIVMDGVFNIPNGAKYPFKPQPWYVDCATEGAYAAVGKCPCADSGTCTRLPASKVVKEDGGRRGQKAIALQESVFFWPGMNDPSESTVALANSTNQLDNFFIPYWRGYNNLLDVYVGFQSGGEMILYPGEQPVSFAPYPCPTAQDSQIRPPCQDSPGPGKYMNPTTGTDQPGEYNGEREYDPRNRGWYLEAAKSSLCNKVAYDKPYINAFNSAKREWLLSLSFAVYNRLSTGGYDCSKDGLVGVIGLDLQIQDVQEIINSKTFASTGYASLVTPDGTVVATPGWNPDTWQNSDGKASTPPKIFDPDTGTTGWKATGLTKEKFDEVTAKQNADKVVFEYKQGDQTWLLARTSVPPIPKDEARRSLHKANFYVLVHVDQSKVLEPLKEMKAAIEKSTGDVVGATIIASICVTVTIALLIMCQTRSITRPLSEMVVVANKISSHDSGARQKSKKEDLAKLVNKMHTPDNIIGSLVREFQKLVLGLNRKDQVASAIVVDDQPPEINKYKRGTKSSLRGNDGKFIWEADRHGDI